MLTTPHPSWGERALSDLFGSDVRARLIARLCGGDDDPLIARQIARELGLPPTTVHDELVRLEALGLLIAGQKIGTAKPYYVNAESPLLTGLRAIVQHTVGVVGLLRQALADRDDIHVALIFGSVAAGSDRPDSDIDLMVIGAVSGSDLAAIIAGVERLTRRQINQVHYSVDEFAQRAREGGSFLQAALGGPLVFVKGDGDALRDIAQ